MKALRITALVASGICLAVLVSPAVASGPVTSPAAGPTAEGPYVTAMGVGVAQPSPIDPLASAQTLYVGVQSTADAAGVQAAVDEMVARLDAIKAALVKAGVPADGIRMMGFNVNPMYAGGKPVPSPEKPQAPQVSSLSVAGNLMVEVPSIRLVAAAMNAASAAGATSVNANAGKGGPQFGATQPSAADLAKATQLAVANARTNAEALAAASGRKLGAIRSISSQLPMAGCCPPSFGWTVQATVTFELAGP